MEEGLVVAHIDSKETCV